MADVFTPKKRSEVMSRIRGRGNRETELRLAALLRANGLNGWRRHLPLIGRPDFAFPRQKVVIFVDGCFWHCCPRCGSMPQNNRVFWKRKLEGNVARDKSVTAALKRSGWKVIRIWEHELKKETRVTSKLKQHLQSQVPRTSVTRKVN